jgi:hypothetical protein
VWVRSNFSDRSSPRDVAVRQAHRSLEVARRSNYDFKEIRGSGCLSEAYDLKAPRPSRKGEVQWPGSLVMGTNESQQMHESVQSGTGLRCRRCILPAA